MKSLTLSYDLEKLMEFLSRHFATLFADLSWIESEPDVCHWTTGGKLSESPQRLARHPTSRSFELVGEGH